MLIWSVLVRTLLRIQVSVNMFRDVYNLKWKNFNVNQDSTLEELFTKINHPDVTLVSDDKVAFPAHKFILGACSPILKDLLINNPHPHPMIYLGDTFYPTAERRLLTAVGDRLKCTCQSECFYRYQTKSNSIYFRWAPWNDVIFKNEALLK